MICDYCIEMRKSIILFFKFVKIAKMNTQEILFKIIRKRLTKEQSINDLVAQLLQISYDAAHRRVSGKSKLLMEEAIVLCKYFSISMDLVFDNKKQLVVQKSDSFQNDINWEEYIKNADFLIKAILQKDATVYYLSKDIPLFYTSNSGKLSKFKYYVWSNLLNKHANPVDFEKFMLNFQMLEHHSSLLKNYANAKRIEFWNQTTIHSVLQQLHFYFDARLIETNSVQEILDDLKKILQQIEHQTYHDKNYQLHYHEMLILNNQILINNQQKLTFILPYNMLSYLVSHDQNTNEECLLFFENQQKNSIQLGNSNPKETSKFFKNQYHKIEQFKRTIELSEKMKQPW